MRRKLAYAAARWLGKRENRDKLMQSARNLKQRIEREEGVAESRTDRTSRKHAPESPHKDDDAQRPPNDRS